ncbi:MAG: xylulokinase [Roseiflexaceae bacterium]
MPGELLLGIDIGTQSTRAAVLTTAGAVVASASRQQELITPAPGWAEQNPDLWWANAVACIAEVLARVDRRAILAIGVGGQMHGTVPLGHDGSLLSQQVQLWCDKRSAGLVEAFAHHPLANEAAQISASPAVANWIGFKIQWLRQHAPDLYANTWKFVVPKDYINYRLTGVVATDYSEASGAFLMDSRTRTWSPLLADALAIDLDKLPPIHRSAAVIGHVAPAAAAQTGLLAGTPVVAGGGDMLCMLLAAGLIEPGAASDITGTSGIFSVFTAAPVYDPRLMNLHHVSDGWVPFGITDSGGVALRWFRDSLGQYEQHLAAQAGIDPYDLIGDLAAQMPAGSEGLLFFPYLLGERTLGSPYSRAAFIGLTPRHGVGALARAIMEGVTFELRRTLDIVEQAGHPVRVIYHTGGGARSVLWSQIKADIYNKPVMTFAESEGGILGAALLAGVGAGVYASEAEGARRCLRFANTFTPDPERAAYYAALYRIFTDLHDRLQEPFVRLAKLSEANTAAS